MTRRVSPFLWGWLAVLLLSIGVISQTRFTADMSAFLPEHPSAGQAFLVEQLKGGAVSRMLLLGIAGASLEQRTALSKALERAMNASGLFSAVRNGNAATGAADRRLVFDHRYLLSPKIDAQRFSSAGLHREIGNSIDLLTSGLGMLTQQLVTRDPTGETLNLIDTFSDSGSPHTRNGVWVSPDAKVALLMAQTRADGSDTDAMQTAIQTIHRIFARLRTQAAMGKSTSSPPQLLITGAPVFSVNARATIKSDVRLFSIISSLAIMLLLWFAYRSLPMLLLGLLPVISGVLVAIAAVSLGFGTVHGITIGFGTTLIGESIDYSIYYFIQSQGDAQGGMERFWPTIRLGVLTSVTGFAALLFSGFPGLAQIGLYSIAGLTTAALVTRFGLPGIGAARFNRHSLVGLGGRIARLLPYLPRLRLPLLLAALCGLALLLARPGAIWQTGLSGLSPIPEQAKQLDQRLRQDMGAPDARYFVVVHAKSEQGALQGAERAGRLLQPLLKDRLLSSFDSPSRFLPSAATQRARRAALPDRATLEHNLDAALQGLPIHADKLQPFVAAVERARSGPLLKLSDLHGTSFALALSTLLQQRDGHWIALLPLHVAASTSPQRVGTAVRHALAAAPIGTTRIQYIDMLGESNQLYNGYLNNTITLSLLGLLGIMVLLTVALRSPRRLFRVLTPLAMAVILVMAGLVLSGEKLTLLHLIGLLLIVAVGSNYALFFNRGGSPDPQILASLVLANTTTVIAFGTLGFSGLPILHAFGSTVAPGAILALLLSATFAVPAAKDAPSEQYA